METKLLDLNAYGVSEMSNAEMRDVNGGWDGTLFGWTIFGRHCWGDSGFSTIHFLGIPIAFGWGGC